MLSYEEALERVLSEEISLGSEELPVSELSGRVLSQALEAAIDLPAFDNSAMDGYAVRTPVEHELKVTGEVAAGTDPSNLTVGPGEAVRIFTGAPVPAGADAIVMQEQVERRGEFIRLTTSPSRGEFIRVKGEEVRRGDLIAEAGTYVGPAVLGWIAAAGLGAAHVWPRPRVRIVETGSELVAPGSEVAGAGVFAANGLAIAAACRAYGCEASVEQCGDDRDALSAMLDRAISDSNILITSGGVSVGEHDLVRPVLQSLGVSERFWRVAIRPGRPLYLGRASNGTVVFGLPGNPASALVTFHLFVMPLLRSVQLIPVNRSFEIETGEEIVPAPAVTTFMRVGYRKGRAVPIESQGSNMISSVAKAEGLLMVPPGSDPLKAGSRLRIIPLVWGLQ